MEYDKVRYPRLNQVVKKAVEHTLKKSLMPEQVQKCFPTISASEGGPEALETARKQIQKYFHGTCVKQVEHIFNERDIEQKLDELDEIIQSAQRARDEGTRNQIHVDMLLPKELIQASLTDAKQDTEKKLAMIYEQLVLDNQQFCQDLLALTNESRDLSNGIMSSIEELSGEVDEMKMAGYDENIDVLMGQFFAVRP